MIDRVLLYYVPLYMSQRSKSTTGIMFVPDTETCILARGYDTDGRNFLCLPVASKVVGCRSSVKFVKRQGLSVSGVKLRQPTTLFARVYTSIKKKRCIYGYAYFPRNPAQSSSVVGEISTILERSPTCTAVGGELSEMNIAQNVLERARRAPLSREKIMSLSPLALKALCLRTEGNKHRIFLHHHHY